MNIEEEIKNITNYIDKIENNIIFENNKLLTQEEINKEINTLTLKINDIDKQLISINNTINIYNGNKKKCLSNEKQIYDTELKRIIDKKILIKEENNMALKRVIKNGIELFSIKKYLLSQIKYTTNQINKFNDMKKQIRANYIKNIKVTNKNIKGNRTNSELNNMKKKLSKLEYEIDDYNNKKNNIINTIDNKNNTKLMNKLEELDYNQMKLNKKRNVLLKYINQNNNLTSLHQVNRQILNNKLPNDYKTYKAKLTALLNELSDYNKLIDEHKLQLIDCEMEINDNYINNLIENEHKRCITRWNKMNERINNDMQNYKNSFMTQITELQDMKSNLQRKLHLLKNNKTNVTPSEKENIIKNNELLSTIKNRLNYLKKMKN